MVFCYATTRLPQIVRTKNTGLHSGLLPSQGDPTGRRHVDVVKAVIGAGADAKHRVDGVRLLHRIIKGGTAIC